MSWSDLSNTTKKDSKNHDELVALAKNYHACFVDSEAGKKVLEHLVNKFIMTSETPFNSPNIEYEAGYHAGEAGLVKMILNQIERAQKI